LNVGDDRCPLRDDWQARLDIALVSLAAAVRLIDIGNRTTGV
jgi:hypothetical protein